MQKILRGGAIVAVSPMLLSCSAAIIPEGAAPPSVASRPVNPPARIPQYNPRSPPSPALVKIIHDLGRNFDGHVGIAVKRVDADWVVDYNGNELFPQQSVSKLWVALTLLDAVARGKRWLNDNNVVRREDLTLFHQPLIALVDGAGYRTPLRGLFNRAMQPRDNHAYAPMLRTVRRHGRYRSE